MLQIDSYRLQVRVDWKPSSLEINDRVGAARQQQLWNKVKNFLVIK